MEIIAKALVFIANKVEEAGFKFEEAIEKAEDWYEERKKDKPEA